MISMRIWTCAAHFWHEFFLTRSAAHGFGTFGVANLQIAMLVRFDPLVFCVRSTDDSKEERCTSLSAGCFGAFMIYPPRPSPFLVLRFLLWPCAATLRLKASETCTYPFSRVSPLTFATRNWLASFRWDTKHSAAPPQR